MPLLLDQRKIDNNYLNELLTTLGLADDPPPNSFRRAQRVSIGGLSIARPWCWRRPTGNLDSKNSKGIVGLLKLTSRHITRLKS